MGKAHSNKGRYFEFKDSDEMYRFILMYKDLFVPYSEDVIRSEARVKVEETRKTKNGNLWTRKREDENIKKTARVIIETFIPSVRLT